jgi:hypothetical protein
MQICEKKFSEVLKVKMKKAKVALHFAGVAAAGENRSFPRHVCIAASSALPAASWHLNGPVHTSVHTCIC